MSRSARPKGACESVKFKDLEGSDNDVSKGVNALTASISICNSGATENSALPCTNPPTLAASSTCPSCDSVCSRTCRKKTINSDSGCFESYKYFLVRS